MPRACNVIEILELYWQSKLNTENVVTTLLNHVYFIALLDKAAPWQPFPIIFVLLMSSFALHFEKAIPLLADYAFWGG